MARGVAVLAVCVGCTSVGRYDAKYFAPLPIDAEKRLDGRALIQTTAEDDAQVYTGRATTLVGSGMTLVLPLGRITREAALNVFGALFRGGAEAATDGHAPGAFRVIVSPRVERFSHSYGIGDFRPAISLSVSVLDPAGKTLDRRTYEFSGSATPSLPMEDTGEYTTRAVQVIVQALMVRAAADVRAVLLAAPAER